MKRLSEKQLQILSRVITHYVYRNLPVIEDNHSDLITMSDEFYSDVHKNVSDKLKEIFDNYRRVESVIVNCANAIKPEMLHSHTIEIDILFYANFGLDWDKEVYIGPMTDKDKKDTAAYILNGKFKEHCNKKSKFGDSTMCDINKDINNRVYTLILDTIYCD